MHFSSDSSRPSLAREEDLEALSRFIAIRWSDLVRNNYGILDLAIDPKWPLRQGEKWIIYVNKEDPAEIEATLSRMNSSADLQQIEIKQLPENAVSLPRQGALYLPYPYVVPGGRFQECYAWDSAFIFIGLLLDGKIRLAQNMVDNHLYEVEHYGAVLNGNRSYYTTRSQLPFLGEMVLRMYAVNDDSNWLAQAVRLCEKYHAYYTSGGHNVDGTGLQRFFDFGPPGSAPPEADMHERDKDGRTPHDRVKEYYRQNYSAGIPDYNIADMYNYDKDELTAKYFDSDRAMRESGFDTSGRFGKFGANCLAYLPVCLNSLLYLLEKNIAEIHSILGRHDRSNSIHARHADVWLQKADTRRATFMWHCWDEEDGLFYDFDHEQGRRRRYVFGTTFLPLWVGMATPEQAKRVVETAMPKLSYPGGLSTSDQSLDTQWDCPFGWAPLQLFAVEGMQRYGYKEEANRIAINFASCVLKVYLKTGELWEKYDVLRRSEKVVLRYGYDTNEVRIPVENVSLIAPHLVVVRIWLAKFTSSPTKSLLRFLQTNAVFAQIIRGLSSSERKEVLKLDGIGAHVEDNSGI